MRVHEIKKLYNLKIKVVSENDFNVPNGSIFHYVRKDFDKFDPYTYEAFVFHTNKYYKFRDTEVEEVYIP